MYQIYKKVQKAVVWVFMAIVYFTEVFIPVILCAQVIGRKFLHSPILGAEELASFAFTAMVLFGSAAICYQKKYIVVDVFVKRFKGRAANIAAAAADLCTLVVYGALIYCFHIAIPVQAKFTSGIFGVPKSVYAIAMMICFAFMCCCTVEYIILDIKAAIQNTPAEQKGAFG